MTPRSGRPVRSTVPMWYWTSDAVELRPDEEEPTYWVRNGAYMKAVDVTLAHLDDLTGDELTAAHERLLVLLNYWSLQCLGASRFMAAWDLLNIAEKWIPKLPSKLQLKMRKLTLCNLAKYFKERRKIKAAIQYLEQAIHIEVLCKDDIDPYLHVNYGVLLCSCNRHADAVRGHFERAIAALRLAYQKGVSRESLSMLVVTYYNTWAAKMTLKQVKDASDCIHRAALLLRDAPADIRPRSLAKKVEQALEKLPLPAEKSVEQPEMSSWNTRSLRPLPRLKHVPAVECRKKISQTTTPRFVFHKQASHTGDTFCKSTCSATSLYTTFVTQPSRPINAKSPLQATAPGFRSKPLTVDRKKIRKDAPSFLLRIQGGEPQSMHADHEELRVAQALKAANPSGTGHEMPSPLGLAFDSHSVPTSPGPPTPPKEHHAADMERLQAIALLRMRKTVPADKERLIPSQAAVKIQAFWRGWSVRQYSLKELACDPLKDNKRKSTLRVVYAARRAFVEYGAAVKIQSHVRGYLFRTMVQDEVKYTAAETAVFLQAYARGFIKRVAYKRMRRAATLIQAAVRRHHKMRKYRILQACLARINHVVRGHTLRCRQKRVRSAQTTIVRWCKGYAQRCRLKSRTVGRQPEAAFKIQKVFRGLSARAHMSRLHQMQVRIAKHVRGNNVRAELHRDSLACVRIQSCWRAYLVRKRLKTFRRVIPTLREANRKWRVRGTKLASLITQAQAMVRGVQCRHKLCCWFFSVRRIQAWARGIIGRRRLLLRGAAAICIQAQWRSVLESKRVWQSTFSPARRSKGRCAAFSYRSEFNRRTKAVSLLQRFWRSALRGDVGRISISREDREEKKKRYRQMVSQRSHYLAVKRSASILQDAWRWRVVRVRFSERTRAALVLQRAARRRLNVRYGARLQRAARCLQAHWRGNCCRKMLLRRTLAQTRLAAMVRRVRAACFYRDKQRKAIKTQACVRMFLTRKRFRALRRYVRVIQSAFRRKRTLKKCAVLARSVRSIQALWRAQLARRALQEPLARRMRAICHLQYWWRKRAAQKRVCAENIAGIILQQHYARFLSQRHAAAKVDAAARIQRFWREDRPWSAYRKHRMNAIRTLRMFLCLLRFRAQRRATRHIQRCWRGHYVRRCDSRHQQQAARLIQHGISPRQPSVNSLPRMMGAVIIIQALVRAWFVRRQLKFEKRAAIQIQAYARMRAVQQCTRKQRWAAHVLASLLMRARLRRMRWAHGVRKRCLLKLVRRRRCAQRSAPLICAQKCAIIFVRNLVRNILVQERIDSGNPTAIVCGRESTVAVVQKLERIFFAQEPIDSEKHEAIECARQNAVALVQKLERDILVREQIISEKREAIACARENAVALVRQLERDILTRQQIDSQKREAIACAHENAVVLVRTLEWDILAREQLSSQKGEAFECAQENAVALVQKLEQDILVREQIVSEKREAIACDRECAVALVRQLEGDIVTREQLDSQKHETIACAEENAAAFVQKLEWGITTREQIDTEKREATACARKDTVVLVQQLERDRMVEKQIDFEKSESIACDRECAVILVRKLEHEIIGRRKIDSKKRETMACAQENPVFSGQKLEHGVLGQEQIDSEERAAIACARENAVFLVGRLERDILTREQMDSQKREAIVCARESAVIYVGKLVRNVIAQEHIVRKAAVVLVRRLEHDILVRKQMDSEKCAAMMI